MAIQCGIISEKYPESNSIVQSPTLSQDPVVHDSYFAHPSRQPREITVTILHCTDETTAHRDLR